MILSDRSIREALASGRIVIEPLNEDYIQPSSVDLTIDRYFRVFLNHTMSHIDVKENQEDLTELVEIGQDEAFILHPGEFVLGSTAERVALPEDLVARLEGKSSLGRLGLLIHSSLPASERLLVLTESGTHQLTIEEIVRKNLKASVVAFDPETLKVGYHEITGWYEGPPDRIYEVCLRSGRRIRVTGGHNLFTLDRHGRVLKVRTLELGSGTRVAIPRVVPDAPIVGPTVIDVRQYLPDNSLERFAVEGPTVAERIGEPVVAELLREWGFPHTHFYRKRRSLPLHVAVHVPGLLAALRPEDRFRTKGGRNALPVVITVTDEVAWLLGLFVAEGHRRRNQVVVANTKADVLDRAQGAFAELGIGVCRAEGSSVTCTSDLLSKLLGWIGTGGGARTKRIPDLVYGWPSGLVQSFLEGMVDGDGSREGHRNSYWTASPGLANDLLLLTPRLGMRSAADPSGQRGDSQGDLMWDTVVEVVDTGEIETIFDIEVRPDGKRIENFLAGQGGVFVSNTAGFVDAGFDGHLTLELSNVANLPIKLYPGMKIGQVSFLQMTTPADNPYGSRATGSKYQGQRGPTASRYFENFRT